VPGRTRPPLGAACALALAVTVTGCWRIGEPTPGDALVTWAAYPDTVRVGGTFSFEFAGPITPTACGRLDTATIAVSEDAITLAARRSTFQTAACANQRVSFYEARPLRIERAGTYAVRTAEGRDLGTLVATDSGPFTPIRTRGDGTVREVGGCLLFGPGWIGNQRVFTLAGAPRAVRDASEDLIVHVRGTLRGFSSCGSWGSRPRIRVDTAWVTDRRADDWYGADSP